MHIHAPIPEKTFILITFRPCDAASIFKNLRIDAVPELKIYIKLIQAFFVTKKIKIYRKLLIAAPV